MPTLVEWAGASWIEFNTQFQNFYTFLETLYYFASSDWQYFSPAVLERLDTLNGYAQHQLAWVQFFVGYVLAWWFMGIAMVDRIE